MHNTSAVLVGGLGAAIAWGLGDYFSARAAKRSGPILAAVAIHMIEVPLFFIPFIFLVQSWQGTLSLTGMAYAAVAGVLIALAGVYFYRGLKSGPVSLVSPLSSLYPLVTTMLAIVAFGAVLSLPQLIGVVLIVLGVVLATGLAQIKMHKPKIRKGPMNALRAAVLWGFGYALLAQGVARLGWQVAIAIEFLVMALTFITIAPYVHGRETIRMRKVIKLFSNKYVFLAAVGAVFGLVVFSFGLSHDKSSGALVTALSATYPLVTVFLALSRLKEKVQLVPLAGAFVGVAGVIILSLY